MIVQQRFQVAILKRHLAALQKNQDRTPILQQKMSRVNIQVDLPATRSLTRKALKEAQIRLMETSQVSFETRQQEVQQRIQELSNRANRPKQKILQSIRKSEQSSKTYQMLKSIRRSQTMNSKPDRIEIPVSWPTMNQQINSDMVLEDPKTCTQWKTITEPQEVELYLTLRNRQHFGQAQGTPFTTPPFQELFDWNASTEAAEALLAP